MLLFQLFIAKCECITTMIKYRKYDFKRDVGGLTCITYIHYHDYVSTLFFQQIDLLVKVSLELDCKLF